MDDQDQKFMALALEQANLAAELDEVPIGAVLVNATSGAVIAAAGNRTITNADPTAHAEILCIREACRKAGSQRIPDHDLYITLEPCAMCAGAISFARIRRVIFAAPDPKGGGILHGGQFFSQPTCHHRPMIDHGIGAEESGKILRDFFVGKRQKKL